MELFGDRVLAYSPSNYLPQLHHNSIEGIAANVTRQTWDGQRRRKDGVEGVSYVQGVHPRLMPEAGIKFSSPVHKDPE